MAEGIFLRLIGWGDGRERERNTEFLLKMHLILTVARSDFIYLSKVWGEVFLL